MVGGWTHSHTHKSGLAVQSKREGHKLSKTACGVGRMLQKHMDGEGANLCRKYGLVSGESFIAQKLWQGWLLGSSWAAGGASDGRGYGVYQQSTRQKRRICVSPYPGLTQGGKKRTPMAHAHGGAFHNACQQIAKKQNRGRRRCGPHLPAALLIVRPSLSSEGAAAPPPPSPAAATVKYCNFQGAQTPP